MAYVSQQQGTRSVAVPAIIMDIETADGGARQQDPGGEGVTAVVQLVNARSVALIAGQARNAAPQRGIAGIRDMCRSCPQFQARQRIEQADRDRKSTRLNSSH